MAITRKQIVTGVSVVYLLGLTILAGFALHSTHVYSLPIPDFISALTVALPPLAGISLETILSCNERLAAKGQIQASRTFQVVIGFFLIYETVLATLAGTHISPPGSLNCALRETWEKLYQRKDADRIKLIQNAFSCCGFKSPLDMAYPLPDATHGHDACLKRYERDQACIDPWREEERKVAIMLLIVPLAVFLWKVSIVLAPSSQSSWMPSHIRLPSDTTSSGDAVVRPRPAIGYRDIEDEGEADSLQREVTNLNKSSQLDAHVERSRTKSSGLTNDAARWRDTAGEGE